MNQLLVSEDEKVVTSNELPEARVLSRALDRCDRCGAQAYYLARHKVNVGHELLFCNHHGVKFRDMLTGQGFAVSDQSKALFQNTKPDSSAAA